MCVLLSACVSVLKLQHALSYSESGCHFCELPKSLSLSYLFVSYNHLTSLFHIKNE